MPRHPADRHSSSERASLLVERMTVMEKCMQLVSVGPWEVVGGDARSDLAAAPGHIYGVLLDDPQAIADQVGLIQRRIMSESRVGVPALFHAEALNGYVSGGHMVFPTAIGLAATWSPDLVEAMTTIIRGQMRRAGVLHALSPVLDVALDPRWGRVHETYGEDPYLAAALGVAFVRGLQGADLRDGVIATGKHFLGYANSEAGLNQASVEAGPRRVRDLFAFPFEAAIQMTGLRSIMNSYSELDGVPAGASRAVLTDLLRDTLGFTGFVSSDYMTIEHLVNRQRVASDAGEAGVLALEAGLDVEFPHPFGFGAELAEQVERGRVSITAVDQAVHRVLAAKFDVGLFERPFPTERIDLASTAAEGGELSLELARRSVILAAHGDLLPLVREQRVALLGPHATDVSHQFAPYTYAAFREMTLVMSSGGMGTQMGVDPGLAEWNARMLAPVPIDEFVRNRHGATSLADELRSRVAAVDVKPGSGFTSPLEPAAFEAAVRAAAAADVVILALGGSSLWFQGERTEGESSDSADISLPAPQVALAEAAIATGTPVVLVLIQGRAYTLPPSLRDAPAIIVSSYNGPFGHRALAEVLTGEVEPQGRLPYSIPLHQGQVPIYHHQKAGTGRNSPLPIGGVPTHYLDLPATPWLPFGWGLGYTTFEIAVVHAPSMLDIRGSATITVSVTNAGERAGVCLPQLYARTDSIGVVRPAQQLLGFERVPLEPGETAEVDFMLDGSQFAFSTARGDFAVEPATVDWFVGDHSNDRAATGGFVLSGERRSVASAERVFLTTSRVRAGVSA